MRRFILCISILTCFCSCRNNSSVGARASIRIAPSFPGLDSNITRDLSGEMESICMVMENPFGNRHHSPGAQEHIDMYITSSEFCDSSGYRLRAKGVKLNGVPVPFGDSRMIQYPDPVFGIVHRWQVTPDVFGFDLVPTIDDSVLSPNYYRVTYPRPIVDTVSKSKGFTCTYGNPGTDSVIIYISYDSVMTTMIDSSNHSSYLKPRGFVRTKSANTGSYFVSDSLISSFPSSGVIQVWVNALRSKVISVTGHRYLLLAGVRARTSCFIKS